MKIGEMNRRVMIQERIITRDTGGGRVETWHDVVSVWASVKPASAAEITLGMQSQQELTHTVGMRFRPLTKKNRLLYNGRVLDIQTVINVDEESRFLKIKCREV